MPPGHTAFATVKAPIDFCFGRLCDPRHLGRWTLGSMDYQPTAIAGVHVGTSLFDGSKVVVEIRPIPDLAMIDYHVGSLEKRVPRVSIRLVAGTDWGLDAASCIAAMTTWRTATMSDERWARTQATHDLEVLLFKDQLEAAWKANA